MTLTKLKNDRLFLPFIITAVFSYTPVFIDVFQGYVSWLGLLGNIYAVATAAILLGYIAFKFPVQPKAFANKATFIKIIELFFVVTVIVTILYTFMLIIQGRVNQYGPLLPAICLSILFGCKLRLKHQNVS
ncbi:MAG TPA: hypothetical protein PKC21_07175 [Oligoflexia bacterium]|nr:hypothetical protein [Oligoflexia bacterium]HMR25119.1 hypothetical protein [Oligoflexia bacterium]